MQLSTPPNTAGSYQIATNFDLLNPEDFNSFQLDKFTKSLLPAIERIHTSGKRTLENFHDDMFRSPQISLHTELSGGDEILSKLRKANFVVLSLEKEATDFQICCGCLAPQSSQPISSDLLEKISKAREAMLQCVVESLVYLKSKDIKLISELEHADVSSITATFEAISRLNPLVQSNAEKLKAINAEILEQSRQPITAIHLQRIMDSIHSMQNEMLHDQPMVLTDLRIAAIKSMGCYYTMREQLLSEESNFTEPTFTVNILRLNFYMHRYQKQAVFQTNQDLKSTFLRAQQP